jgi:stress-induced morphogen
MVYALLADEIAPGVHALALQTLAPGEPWAKTPPRRGWDPVRSR